MDNQQAFTQIKNHLLTQNQRAEIDGTCQYRMETDNHVLTCAVGCLIPDELYREDMESTTIKNLVSYYTKLGEYFQGIDLDLLHDLQMIHDQHDIDTWPLLLKDVATKWELDYDAVQ